MWPEGTCLFLKLPPQPQNTQVWLGSAKVVKDKDKDFLP